MQYEGKLYGKIPAGYIPLTETTKDVDAMRERIMALEDALKMALPYVQGAYECAFPDQQENEFVIETIEKVITKS